MIRVSLRRKGNKYIYTWEGETRGRRKYLRRLLDSEEAFQLIRRYASKRKDVYEQAIREFPELAKKLREVE